MSDNQIMLVDDNPEFQVLFQSCLTDTRFSVGGMITSAREALNEFNPARYTFAIVSLDLPVNDLKEVDGITEFIERFHDEYPDTILLVSHTVDTKFLVRRAINAGATWKVKKPLKEARVLKSLIRAEHYDQGTLPLLNHPFYLEKRITLDYKKNPDSLFSFLKSSTTVCTSCICPEGVKFGSEQQLQEGDVLEMEMNLPWYDEPINCRGEVVESEKKAGVDLPRVVVEFQDLDDETENSLERQIIYTAARTGA